MPLRRNSSLVRPMPGYYGDQFFFSIVIESLHHLGLILWGATDWNTLMSAWVRPGMSATKTYAAGSSFTSTAVLAMIFFVNTLHSQCVPNNDKEKTSCQFVNIWELLENNNQEDMCSVKMFQNFSFWGGDNTTNYSQSLGNCNKGVDMIRIAGKNVMIEVGTRFMLMAYTCKLLLEI